MPSYKSDLIEYDLIYLGQTDKGLCVRQDEEHELFWLPKSQIEFEDKIPGSSPGTKLKRGSVIRVTIPEWLAARSGLLG